MKKIYCSDCKKITEHIPKLTAVLEGTMVCDECSKQNQYCTLLKPDTPFFKSSKRILWLEFNEDGTFKEKHETPAVGRSLIMSPFNDFFTWQTTDIIEIVEKSEDYIKFKTGNSLYELYYTDEYKVEDE
jgi:NAD-dependent SIR2 family protein deacetylase